MWGNEVSQQPTMCLMNVCTVGTNKPHSRSNTRRKFTFSLFICTNYKTKKNNNTLQTTNNTTAPACICVVVVVDLSAQSASYFFWFLETQTCSQDQLPVCQTWTRTCCQSLTPVVYSNHSSSLPLPLPLPPGLQSNNTGEHFFPSDDPEREICSHLAEFVSPDDKVELFSLLSNDFFTLLVLLWKMLLLILLNCLCYCTISFWIYVA